MIRSPRRASALVWSLLLTALAGCGDLTPLTPIEDPSGNGETAYDLDLELPEQLDPVPNKTSPYVSSLRLYIAVEDARDDRVRLGKLTGGPAPISVVGSGMLPPVFVGQVVAKALADDGMTLVDREDTANRVLRFRVVRFFTEKQNMYHGEVEAIAEVLDSKKQVIAGIKAMGSARQCCRFTVSNFREVFARATMDMARNVLENGEIQAALNVQTDTARPPAPADAADAGAI